MDIKTWSVMVCFGICNGRKNQSECFFSILGQIEVENWKSPHICGLFCYQNQIFVTSHFGSKTHRKHKRTYWGQTLTNLWGLHAQLFLIFALENWYMHVTNQAFEQKSPPYLWALNDIFGHFWSFSLIFGHFRSFSVIFCHLWSFVVICGHFWSFSVIFAHFRSFSFIFGE